MAGHPSTNPSPDIFCSLGGKRVDRKWGYTPGFVSVYEFPVQKRLTPASEGCEM